MRSGSGELGGLVGMVACRISDLMLDAVVKRFALFVVVISRVFGLFLLHAEISAFSFVTGFTGLGGSGGALSGLLLISIPEASSSLFTMLLNIYGERLKDYCPAPSTNRVPEGRSPVGAYSTLLLHP